MANGYFRVEIISRGGSRQHNRKPNNSAKKAMSYFSDEIIESVEGKKIDGRKKSRTGKVEGFSFMPESAKDKRDIAVFSNSLDAIEKRIDASLFRHVIVVISNEILEANEQYAYSFIELMAKGLRNMKQFGFVFLHDLGTHNTHLHFLMSIRPIDEITGDFATKKPKLTRIQIKEQFEAMKMLYQQSSNHVLEQINSASRVDMRSYKERGIHRIPYKKHLPYSPSKNFGGLYEKIINQNEEIEIENYRIAKEEAFQTDVLKACKRFDAEALEKAKAKAKVEEAKAEEEREAQHKEALMKKIKRVKLEMNKFYNRDMQRDDPVKYASLSVVKAYRGLRKGNETDFNIWLEKDEIDYDSWLEEEEKKEQEQEDRREKIKLSPRHHCKQRGYQQPRVHRSKPHGISPAKARYLAWRRNRSMRW